MGQILVGIVAVVLGGGLWVIRRTVAAGMQRQRARRGRDSAPDAGDYLTAYAMPILVVGAGVAAIIHGALAAW